MWMKDESHKLYSWQEQAKWGIPKSKHPLIHTSTTYTAGSIGCQQVHRDLSGCKDMSAVAKVHTKVLFDLKSELSKQNRTKKSPPQLENKPLLFSIFVIKTEECAYHHEQITIRETLQQLSYSFRQLSSKSLSSIFCPSSSYSFKCFFWANKRLKENFFLFSAWNTLLQDDSVIICKVHS